jgi:hypothetical protein
LSLPPHQLVPMGNVTKMEKEKILSIIKDYKNSSNNELKIVMDVLQEDFEITKKAILEMTFHLDKLEKTYDLILKEYQTRTKTI